TLSRSQRFADASTRAISSVGERCLHTAEATGSKPVSPTRIRDRGGRRHSGPRREPARGPALSRSWHGVVSLGLNRHSAWTTRSDRNRVGISEETTAIAPITRANQPVP